MTRDQIVQYRDKVYARCRALLEPTSADDVAKHVEIMKFKASLASRVLGQVWNVQHHVGAMHSLLRRHTGSAPQWVALA